MILEKVRARSCPAGMTDPAGSARLISPRAVPPPPDRFPGHSRLPYGRLSNLPFVQR